MQIGRVLSGRLSSYTVQEQLYRTIYSAISSAGERVIIKTERVTHQLNNEKGILAHFRNTPHIRLLLDEVSDPPALVLNRLDGDILEAAKDKPVTGKDLKYVARTVLERIRDMHEAKPLGFIHTDVKPRNILVDYGQHEKGESDRFSEVQLTDFGDAFPTTAVQDLSIKQSSIGAPLWRSPEAIMGMRWGTPTDIWSYGATLLSLVYGRGFHLFRPRSSSPHDPADCDFQVLVQQASHFGPFPDSMKELADENALEMMDKAWQAVQDSKMYQPFETTANADVGQEEMGLLLDIMKLDPRDRPEAGALLGHSWFEA